jgi:hypothetical protein
MAKQYDRWRHYDCSINAPERLGKKLWPESSPLDCWDCAIMDGIALNKALRPIERNRYDNIYLSHQALH